MMDTRMLFQTGVRIGVVLTLVVIVLGAFVRLSDAGLGCPDWPGCYGRLLAPTQATAVEQASLAFPERPVEVRKAWKEMVHRYVAGLLGLLALALAALAWWNRHRPGQPVALPWLLLALVVFQSLLGMWTVTLQLKPLVVMAHLLGGFATLVVFWQLVLATGDRVATPMPGPRAGAPRVDGERTRTLPRGLRPWAGLAAGVLVLQIALGGWTSANYAALACPDLPQCQGQWWPETDFREGFVLWRGTGMDYEYGVLDAPARTAIHVTHRLGALATVLVVGGLAVFVLVRTGSPRLRLLAGTTLAFLLAQAALGVSNVLFHLPLPVAVAHNAMAALLLIAMFTLWHALSRAAQAPGAAAESTVTPTAAGGPTDDRGWLQ